MRAVPKKIDMRAFATPGALCMALASHAADVQHVSLEELVDNRTKFHGHVVELDARANRGFENDTLCATTPGGRPCIWLVWADPPWETQADLERIKKADAHWWSRHRKVVRVRGTFNMNNKGNQDTFPGALEHIERVSELGK